MGRDTLGALCEVCEQPRNRKGNRAKYCEDCALDVKLASNKKWQEDNAEYYKAMRVGSQRRTMLKLRYDITPEDYAERLERQNGVCLICLKPETTIDPRTNKPRWLAVDHDHKTGVVRGLLCAKCNKGLGAFDDDMSVIHRAWHYLHINTN